jgi:hypothetical protein
MHVTANWKRLLWVAAAAAALGASVVMYRSRNAIDWPKAFEAANNLAQIVALIVGGVWALRRFGVTRASRTFLEQINYLADFQDPVGGFTDAGFWLEPNETYELTVPLWLSPGRYALKACFLGEERRRREEEYWSQTTVCRLEAVARQAAAAV